MRKHASLEDCAKQELEEEARLAIDNLIPLLPADAPGICEVKWCVNSFRPFLAIAPATAAAPPLRDAEEIIEVCHAPAAAFCGAEHRHHAARIKVEAMTETVYHRTARRRAVGLLVCFLLL